MLLFAGRQILRTLEFQTSCGWHFEGEGCIHTSENPAEARPRGGWLVESLGGGPASKATTSKLEAGDETGSEENERCR